MPLPPTPAGLRLDEDDGVVTLTLDRPEKLNALDAEMVEGLADVFEGLHDDGAARPVLVVGEGRATCAGMDRAIVSGDYAGEHADLDATVQRVYELVETYPAPVAVAARGALVGMGFLFATASDLLFVAEETRLAVPEISYGIVSDYGTTRLPELVGRRVAVEFLLTGDPIDPDRAASVGLVNAVVAPEEVEATARARLERIAEHDPSAVAGVLERIGR
ncbi:enoyl-CoA hydratase/isomerase family protein [Halomarina litorea]|uniref:enoyl-CoA hydratase/isomerase family protein n=1 Tax=Halomarina litorea TaxID=2961595 RepID=UPI0020C58710|nr:enoyl-CoA hydratase/isomerase family protein [Halomarina sp. BCD28]